VEAEVEEGLEGCVNNRSRGSVVGLLTRNMYAIRAMLIRGFFQLSFTSKAWVSGGVVSSSSICSKDRPDEDAWLTPSGKKSSFMGIRTDWWIAGGDFGSALR
jgi:hypothetical protein